MYNQIYEEMEKADVARKLRVPERQDVNGKTCDVTDSVGCEVIHELAYPEMCIAMYEVGGNASHKGDGHIGGKLLVCGKGMTSQKNKVIKTNGGLFLDSPPLLGIL